MADQSNWLEQTFAEAREILIEFCKEQDIPGGRGLATRVLALARHPHRRPSKPVTEYELFIAVDALGDHVGDSDEPLAMLFEYLRWHWWLLKFKLLGPEESLKTPREVEEQIFHRLKPPLTDRLGPSQN